MPPPPVLEVPPYYYGLPPALGRLMWVGQVEVNGYREAESLTVYGTVRPPEDRPATSEWQALTGLMANLEEILDLLDQAGITLIGFPDIQISGEDGVKMDVRLKVWDIC